MVITSAYIDLWVLRYDYVDVHAEWQNDLKHGDSVICVIGDLYRISSTFLKYVYFRLRYCSSKSSFDLTVRQNSDHYSIHYIYCLCNWYVINNSLIIVNNPNMSTNMFRSTPCTVISISLPFYHFQIEEDSMVRLHLYFIIIIQYTCICFIHIFSVVEISN